MKALLIAEKASLMKIVQDVYKKINFPDTIDFECFSGHVIGLQEPKEYGGKWADKNWSMDMLPINPNIFKYKVIPSKTQLCKKLSDKIKSGNYDYLINCCDPDREGEAIFGRFYDYYGYKMPVKRFWSNDTTEISVKKELLNMKYDNEPFFVNTKNESTLRAQLDWLIGMNLTVVSTLKYGTPGVVFKIGRVKTPVLKMVVDRELAIANFKPVTTFELEAKFETNKNESYMGTYFDDNGITRFKNKIDANSIIKNLSKKSKIESVTKKNEKSYAPQLYKLSKLQKDASTYFGYSGNDTMEIMESLYLKQILTYPRTDNPYISTELAKFFPKLIKATTVISSLKPYADKILKDNKHILEIAKDNKYVNDAEMAKSGHSAIVPTGKIPDLSKLTDKEKNIFLLVAKRLLAIFLPPKVESKSLIITNNNGYKFRTSGKILIDKGFEVLYNTSSKDINLPNVNKGDIVNLNSVNLTEKVSTPPTRFTEGTLVDAMDNPSKYLLDDKYKSTMKKIKGIGTSATRALIINELIENKYIEVKGTKSKKVIYATDLGINVIQNLNGRDIVSVDLTAIWEEKLASIEDGSMSKNSFDKEMRRYVVNTINDIQNSKVVSIFSNNVTLGKCIKCGVGNIEITKNFYKCSEYPNSCNFLIPKNFVGAKITEKDIKDILEGKETRTLSFSKKNGNDIKKWKGKIHFNKTSEKIEFVKGNSISTLKCPKCGKNIKITTKYYMCSGYKDECNFVLSAEYFGAKITLKDMEKLLKGDNIEKTFKWKSGKSSKARLKLENNKYKLIFN